MKGFPNPSNPFSFEGNDAFERCSFLNVCDSWPESPRWPITVTAIKNTSRENQTPHDKNNYFKAKPNTSRQKRTTWRQNQQAYGRTKSSRQKQLLHGKSKYFTAKPIPHGKSKYLTVQPKTHGKRKTLTARPKGLQKKWNAHGKRKTEKEILYQRVLDTNCVRERCSFGIAMGIVFYHDVSFVLPRRSHNFSQRPSFTDW